MSNAGTPTRGTPPSFPSTALVPCSDDATTNTAPQMTSLGNNHSVPAAISSSTTVTTYSEGGYDYELVGVADSRYECPICLLCFRDPVLTTCGHKFCSSCIRVWVVDLGGKCPVDGVSLSHENIFPDNFTRREIMQSKAKCPYSSSPEGCGAILPLNELDRHVYTEHVRRNDSLLVGINGGHPNNGHVPPHFSSGGGADVVDCWFKDIGCDVRVHPSEMHRHTDADVHKHLNLMTMAYKRLKLFQHRSNSNLDHLVGVGSSGGGAGGGPDQFWRQDSRDSQQRWLLGDCDTLDSSEDYEFRRQRSWDSVRFAQNKHNANKRPSGRFYPPRLAESDESLCKPSANHGESGETSRGISSAGATVGGATTSNSSSHQLHDVFERLVRLEQNDREKQIKIEKLQSELASAVNLFSAATNIIKDLTARYCHGVFVWTIPDFRKLCGEMRKNPNHVRHSPGFYTDTFGYKLCLRFNLTTPSSHGAAAVAPVDVPLESDKETFISLYVHFMQGEFDETLRWPFHGELSLLIIHPSNPEHSLVETIIAKPGAAAYNKPSLYRNPTGIGFPEFCPMDRAFTEGYVKNDALVCKIHAKARYIEMKDLST